MSGIPPFRASLVPVALVFLLCLAMPSGADPASVLRAQFWTDLDGIPAEGDEYPLSDATAARRVLDEAAWVFSGMVDGFEFEWVPENRGRQVEERFSLLALGLLAPGDRRLVPGEARRDRTTMRAWIEFHPDAADSRSLESSLGADWKSSQGLGRAGLVRGWAGRREAYEAAIKDGIEAWARSIEPTRPRLVRGRVVFSAVPTLVIAEGTYTVQARIRLEATEILRWFAW